MKHLFTLLLAALSVTGTLCAQTSAPLQGCIDRLRTAERQGNDDSLAAVYADLADYYSYRNPDTLLLYVRKGLQYADKNRTEPYLRLLSNECNYYNATGDSRTCVDKYLFAIAEAHRLSADKTSQADLFSSLGVAYRRIDQPDSAAHCYKRALSLYKDSARGGEFVRTLRFCSPTWPFSTTTPAESMKRRSASARR